MKNYNIDFLTAAFIFLVLIFSHFMREKKLSDRNSRLFTRFFLLGISDIGFDILSTVLVAAEKSSLTIPAKLTLTIFYMIQVLIPYALLYYTESIRGGRKTRKSLYALLVPVLVMEFLVLANIWSGMFFFFDYQGRYFKGPGYMLTYYFAAVYILIVAFSSILHFRELGKKKFLVIWEFLTIAGVCVFWQAMFPQILTIGFGIGLAITVLFLTINNPGNYIDRLTESYNSSYFQNWMQEQMDWGKHFHLVVAELYQVKRIYTVYGNSGAEKLIRQVAAELKRISPSNQVFRIREDRFLIITYSLVEYEDVRHKVSELFEQRFEINHEKVHFPALLCGIISAEELKNCDTLFSYIEYLMDRCPDVGGMTLIQGNDQTLRGFRYAKEVEHFLETAVHEDLYEIYYQPVYSVASGKYITLEALSRLRHPRLGPLSPDVFIAAAEKTGQISQIGYLQFRRVCRFVKDNLWILDQIRDIKFNLSPSEFLKEGQIQKLIETIYEFGLNPAIFQFEITETVATDYGENMMQAVEAIVSAGCGLCMDDFGSGFANLNAVLQLPFSCIKLDRSMLNGICENRMRAEFFRDIIQVFKKMGYAVIAEGVENQEQLKIVSDCRVDMVQGYYFSKPLSEQEILLLLRDEKGEK